MEKSEIYQIGRSARSKAPIITGNCDYISRKFVELAVRSYGYSRKDFKLHIVDVTHTRSNKTFSNGHWIIEIVDDGIYVDLTVDQFNNSNKAYHSFTLGTKRDISSTNIFTDLTSTEEDLSYEIKRSKIPRV
jgi:hypothetical protein